MVIFLAIFTLFVAGCGSPLEREIAKRYTSMGDVIDEYTHEGTVWDGWEEEYVEAMVTDRYKGQMFVAHKSVPETAQEIMAIRKPSAVSPVSKEKMALRYDNWWAKRVVVLSAKKDNNGQVITDKPETLIEVLEPKHAYYRHYSFMTMFWGWGSPFYRRYGGDFYDDFGPGRSRTVPNGSTVRQGSRGSSTRGFLGGGPGFGK